MTIGVPPLSLALGGLQAGDASPAGLRDLVPWARSIGFAAGHLNAAAPGLRARELDRSARRDLAATIRREGLDLSGADLWIPPEHFSDPAQVDRAAGAAIAAMELVAELACLVRGIGSVAARPCISIVLPENLSGAVKSQLATAADKAGVRLADHAPVAERTPSTGIDAGIDPAAALSAGKDPASLVSKLGPALASGRLSDLSRHVGGGRVVPGSRDGRLDLLAYIVALTTIEYTGWVVADTRSLAQPNAAAAAMVEAWTDQLNV